MKKLLILSLLLTGTLLSNTHRAEAQEPPFESYRVSQGDTLWYISGRYGVPLSQLKSLNPTIDPMNMKIGSVVYLRASESKADRIISFGEKFMGVPYVWGGDYDLDGTMGFDCSGFMHYIFAHEGVSIQRQSALSCELDGVRVSRRELKKGDLVYFSEVDKPVGHIGVVKAVNGSGSVEILHTYGKELGVTVSTMRADKSDYWSQHFVTGKRVL